MSAERGGRKGYTGHDGRSRLGPGRMILGWIVAYALALAALAPLLFLAALGALMVVAVFIVVTGAEAANPPWLGIIGFLSGVAAATYVRLKHSSPPR